MPLAVDDCAAYLVERLAPVERMKLHRLCYYAQALHLSHHREPLFSEPIAARASGPFLPQLYQRHHDRFDPLLSWSWGSSERLGQVEQATLDLVIERYAPLSSLQLAQLAQSEEPWRIARQGLIPIEQGQRLIEHRLMINFYRSSAVPNYSSAAAASSSPAP